VQRLFSEFPVAIPGFGLLLLRVVLAFVLLLDGAARLQNTFAISGGGSVETIVYASTLIALSLAVASGFLTPIVQLTVVIVEATGLTLGLVPLPLEHLEQWTAPLLTMTIAIALVMIGPGAYSVDARLFGRREIVIRPRRKTREGGASPTQK
jgi:uncharacterized membrane protein YphA (DoxX/SURF4 family)